QQRPGAFPNEIVVLGENDPGLLHRHHVTPARRGDTGGEVLVASAACSGIENETVMPPLGVAATSKRPSSAATRSAIPVSPIPAAASVMPMPSSMTSIAN